MSAPTIERVPEPGDESQFGFALYEQELAPPVIESESIEFNGERCVLSALPLAIERLIDERRFRVTAYYKIPFDKAAAMSVAEVNEQFFSMRVETDNC